MRNVLLLIRGLFMKFQNVADSIEAMTCIISVEKLPDGSCGEIRIVTGNRAYLDSIEKPVENVEAPKAE